ncbi:hypothetical protein CWR48_04255 [Oceanobacillus arenosus]|uniref:Uncharacterized protein n=1 Tax=Oceanobacillus arenosus TaxID=1229153 RepID=A0A3D8Q0A2_9BACI|nr:hypothetical protein [Oceanobacillus arenosus]RDW21031.1 hypothetical protein CWR48_04255 [Oceanobacillus arenosus]
MGERFRNMADLQGAWEVIAEAFSELAETLESIFSGVVETIEHIDREEDYRQNWYVPKSITLNHQVLDRKPMLANIRNSI